MVDGAVLELYQCVCLCEVNEYSWLIYRYCRKHYSGKVILYGKDWEEWLSNFPNLGVKPNIAVVSTEDALSKNTAGLKTMFLGAFLSNFAGSKERRQNGIFSYDEVMVLLYCFANRKRYGDLNSGKKFYLIDGNFSFEGLVTILNSLSLVCGYVLSKGYIPVFHILSSDQSIYKDLDGDNIWSKFFEQPFGYCFDDIKESRDVTISPNLAVNENVFWFMRQISKFGRFELVTDRFFNQRLKLYMEREWKKVLPHPSKTLGVLIRGTDFAVNRPKGHAIQASVGQMIEKINSVPWGYYENIYLATEDEEILRRMKTEFGERLLYTNQKRFSLKKGEYLFEMEKQRHQEGWLKGAEYLTSLMLLSECESMIASGYCSGTGFALKINNGKYRHAFVFELGRYS